MFAATDTTSGALAHILQLLAEHPEAQARLRAELCSPTRAEHTHGETGEREREREHEHEREAEAEPGWKWSYDELNALPYLDAVVRETLRLCVLPLISPVYI